MFSFILVLLVFVICVGGCWWIFSSIGNYFFGEKKETYTFNSTHIHIHEHKHEHKNISIIDDDTKKKIFELKESKENGFLY